MFVEGVVVDGEAEVISSHGIPLNTLRKGMVFGEMAFLNTNPTVRSACVRAKTDVTLAVLSLDDFNFVMDLYPEFSSQVRRQAIAQNNEQKDALQGSPQKSNNSEDERVFGGSVRQHTPVPEGPQEQTRQNPLWDSVVLVLRLLPLLHCLPIQIRAVDDPG